MDKLVERLRKLHSDCKSWSEYYEWNMEDIGRGADSIEKLLAVLVKAREAINDTQISDRDALDVMRLIDETLSGASDSANEEQKE